MTRSRLRCAVIGTGTFAELCHVPGLQSHPAAEVVAICGNPGRARQLADKFGVAEVCDDAEALCARSDIDAVTIATRNVDHAAHALAALRHNKHVLCEKPLAHERRASARNGGCRERGQRDPSSRVRVPLQLRRTGTAAARAARRYRPAVLPAGAVRQLGRPETRLAGRLGRKTGAGRRRRAVQSRLAPVRPRPFRARTDRFRHWLHPPCSARRR